VIVDYSPTVSDVGGLMYLLSHPDVEVIAISLPATGEAGCDLGIEVTNGILAMLDQEEIPVACDPEFPDGANTWPEDFLRGHENLSSGLPTSTAAPHEETGSELIIEMVLASGRPVTIYAVGPLTNVARALMTSPDIADNLERIVIMGGAVDVPGNTFDGIAEWNIYIDPAAAATVISSGVPITLVPLDATNDVPVPEGYPTTLGRAEQSDQIAYLGRLVDLFPAVTSGFYQFWDELAAAVVTGDVGIETDDVDLSVIIDGSNTGQTARDASGTRVVIATGVINPEAFYEEFITRLAGAPIEGR
jgi:inosine-uridine nucleoside N-ribohydrolase